MDFYTLLDHVVDLLRPAEKHLLQTAAVIGTEVALPLLQAIAEVPEAVLHRGLTHLQAVEFLYETSLFPERAYTFKHALTHEVAYGGLLQERRRALHARIVEAIEALAGDRLAEQVERLAHHALRGEVWDKAVTYCRQAGEKAMARSAHGEAVGYFEQALSALPHLPEQRATSEQAVDLRLALRHALVPSGELGRTLAYLHAAEPLAEALDDPRRLGQVCLFLSLGLTNRGAYDQAITAAQRALALATASGEVVVHALADLYLGVAYYAQGDYRRAIDCFRQTVAFFEGARRCERFGLPFLPAVTSRAWLATCHAEVDTFAEEIVLGDEGLRIAEAVAHPGSLMWASWWGGLLSLAARREPPESALAEAHYRQALALADELGMRPLLAHCYRGLGMLYTTTGQREQARTELAAAIALYRAMDMTFWLPQAEAVLAQGEAR